jgi:hypothetical protein
MTETFLGVGTARGTILRNDDGRIEPSMAKFSK